ncbi:MAG: hypothetical protein WBG38_05460 [Nodosilinea sp.]
MRSWPIWFTAARNAVGWLAGVQTHALFSSPAVHSLPIAMSTFVMSAPLTLNLPQGSLQFTFSSEAAQTLKASLADLMGLLKAAAAQGGEPSRRSPQPPMEYRHTGDVFLEVFCNPNIWPSPFAAKALVTLRDDRIRVTTEAELSQIYDDINAYLA